MKSIKKKAEEYAFIKQGIDSVGIKFIELNTNKQDGFEAGANYVLEQIESLTKYNRWSAQDLYNLIKKLKK